MAYDKNKIYEQAKEVTVKNKLFFIEDIVAFLPISKKTFYEYFPLDSNESNELKDLLQINKTALKVGLRKKWYTFDNATLQMALMKLICTDDERKKLSINHTDVTTNGKDIKSFNLPEYMRKDLEDGESEL